MIVGADLGGGPGGGCPRGGAGEVAAAASDEGNPYTLVQNQIGDDMCNVHCRKLHLVAAHENTYPVTKTLRSRWRHRRMRLEEIVAVGTGSLAWG